MERSHKQRTILRVAILELKREFLNLEREKMTANKNDLRLNAERKKEFEESS